MITFSDLKFKMETSKWPEDLIAKFSSVQSFLGPLTTNFLYRIADEVDPEEAALIGDIVPHFSNWHREIESGSSNEFKTALASVLQYNDQYIIDLISCFVYDLHANRAISSKLTMDFNKDLFLYQFVKIDDLPSSELIASFSSNIVDLAKVFDLESELKRISYYKDYDIDSPEIEKLRLAVENSEQLVTTKNISLNGQEVAGTVKNFIHDYHETYVNLAAGNSSYGVANYVTASPNMKSLSKEEGLVVRRILEAYSFLLYAKYSEEEVEEYESEREAVVENIPYLIMGVEKPVKKQPVAAPAQSSQPSQPAQPLPQRRYIDEISRPNVPAPKPAAPTPKTVSPQPAPHPEVKIPHLAPDPKGVAQRPSEITNPARVRELINHHPDQKPQTDFKPPEMRGIVHDTTNIKVDEEAERIEKDRQQKMDSIARKLEELRQRNQQQ